MVLKSKPLCVMRRGFFSCNFRTCSYCLKKSDRMTFLGKSIGLFKLVLILTKMSLAVLQFLKILKLGTINITFKDNLSRIIV